MEIYIHRDNEDFGPYSPETPQDYMNDGALLETDPLTPQRPPTFCPSTMRRAKKQFPSRQRPPTFCPSTMRWAKKQFPSRQFPSRPSRNSTGWAFLSVAWNSDHTVGELRQYRIVYDKWVEYGGWSVGTNVALNVTVGAAWSTSATVNLGGGNWSPVGVSIGATGQNSWTQNVTMPANSQHGWMATAAFAHEEEQIRGFIVIPSTVYPYYTIAPGAVATSYGSRGLGLSSYSGVLIYE